MQSFLTTFFIPATGLQQQFKVQALCLDFYFSAQLCFAIVLDCAKMRWSCAGVAQLCLQACSCALKALFCAPNRWVAANCAATFMLRLPSAYFALGQRLCCHGWRLLVVVAFAIITIIAGAAQYIFFQVERTALDERVSSWPVFVPETIGQCPNPYTHRQVEGMSWRTRRIILLHMQTSFVYRFVFPQCSILHLPPCFDKPHP